MDFGLPELLVVLVIVLLLFGSTRLPKLARSMGEAMRELREGLTGSEPSKDNEKDQAEKKNPAETNQTNT